MTSSSCPSRPGPIARIRSSGRVGWFGLNGPVSNPVLESVVGVGRGNAMTECRSFKAVLTRIGHAPPTLAFSPFITGMISPFGLN